MRRPRRNVLSRVELIVRVEILHNVLIVEKGTDAKEPANWHVKPKESNVVVDFQEEDVIDEPDDITPNCRQLFNRQHQKNPHG